jgi:hypothetical protein
MTIARRAAVLIGGALLAPAFGVSAQSQDDGWRYSVTPYLWAATLTGDLGADGVEGSTDSGYSFWTLDNLQGYGSAHFAANAERWGWFLDALFVEYGDDFHNALFDTTLGVSGRIYEAGGTYGLEAVPGLSVLAGVRVVDVEVEVGLNPGPDGTARDRWTDPFVGVEYRHPLGDHWYVDARADLGGFGVSSESEAQLIASAGYRFNEHLEAFGGYRYLKAEFRDQVVFDVTVSGPGIGFTWAW